MNYSFTFASPHGITWSWVVPGARNFRGGIFTTENRSESVVLVSCHKLYHIVNIRLQPIKQVHDRAAEVSEGLKSLNYKIRERMMCGWIKSLTINPVCTNAEKLADGGPAMASGMQPRIYGPKLIGLQLSCDFWHAQ